MVKKLITVRLTEDQIEALMEGVGSWLERLDDEDADYQKKMSKLAKDAKRAIIKLEHALGVWVE